MCTLGCNAWKHVPYLCMVQALLQARQVGEGGHNAGPQGSTDITDASMHSLKVSMFALSWGPHQSQQLHQGNCVRSGLSHEIWTCYQHLW